MRVPPTPGNAEVMPIEERHAEELFNLIDRNRAYLRQWLPWLDSTRTAEDSREFIQRSLGQFARHEALVEGIWYNGKLAGVVSYVKIDWPNRSVMIGYWLGEEYQGKSLMTEACRAMIEHAFDELRLNRIEIHVAVDNRRSRAVAERLGFTFEGVLRQAVWMYDHFENVALYSLLREEWKADTETPEGTRTR